MKFNFILLIVIAILILFTIRGYRKGLFGIIFGVISWVFMGFFVFFGTPKMLNILQNNTTFRDKIESGVEGFVSQKIDSMGQAELLKQAENYGFDTGDEALGGLSIPSNLTPSISEEINRVIENNNEVVALPDEYQSVIIEEKQNEIKSELTKAIAKRVTDYVIKGLAFLFTLVIAWIIILIVSIIIKMIENSKGVKTVSHGLGLVFGLLEGFILVFILLYILSCFAMVTGSQNIISDIESNDFLNYLSTHNPIGNLVIKFLK